jgi:hypothetical protein
LIKLSAGKHSAGRVGQPFEYICITAFELAAVAILGDIKVAQDQIYNK